MAIQECDNCGQVRPGHGGTACGIEGFFCHVCRSGELDPYGELQVVRDAMSEQPLSIQVEYRIDRVISELDELMALAAGEDTSSAVESNKIGLGQILTRAQLIVSFLTARETPKFKVIHG